MSIPQDPSNTFVMDVRRIVKQSLTKKSRTDLGRAMIRMCSLTGWQSTTLNPDMSPADKLAIVTTAFSTIAKDATHPDLYDELIRLSACTMGWAQGIARREARDRKRRAREQKKERKRLRKLEKKAAKRVAEQQESAT
jgi:hypothetical protein